MKLRPCVTFATGEKASEPGVFRKIQGFVFRFASHDVISWVTVLVGRRRFCQPPNHFTFCGLSVWHRPKNTYRQSSVGVPITGVIARCPQILPDGPTTDLFLLSWLDAKRRRHRGFRQIQAGASFCATAIHSKRILITFGRQVRV